MQAALIDKDVAVGVFLKGLRRYSGHLILASAVTRPVAMHRSFKCPPATPTSRLKLFLTRN
ncbi:hypothetical protein GCM10009085_26600 [Pseudomonas avellanae]|nr:hypothetical protein GCM10009085_26600 [Pseudomonas avellanae]